MASLPLQPSISLFLAHRIWLSGIALLLVIVQLNTALHHLAWAILENVLQHLCRVYLSW